MYYLCTVIKTRMSELYLETPLWFSIPLTMVYLGAVGYMLYTMYRYSDWRERRITKKNQEKNKKSLRS